VEAKAKKIANTANRAVNKIAKETEAAKKNNGKNKKIGRSTVVDEIREII
jgi:hypothetical protein